MLLLSGSAFFSGSEVAMFSLRRWRVARYQREERGVATVVAELLRRPRRLLVAILIGNETVNIALANVGVELRRHVDAVVPAAALPLTRPLAALLTTLVLVLFGELLSKNLALAAPERVAMLVARPLLLWTRLAAGPCALLDRFAALFSGHGPDAAITTEDFLHLVSEGERAGVLDAHERELIQSVFEFRDMTVRAIMTPRTDIQSLPAHATLEQAIAFVGRHAFSRVPVYDKGPDDIVGIVHCNDLLAHRYGLRAAPNLRAIMSAPLYVPLTKKARDLLRELQRQSLQMAIVLDEYGVTAGLVTMDDLLSEIVGEIADSFEARVEPVTELQPGVYRVLARMALPDFAARTGAAFDAPDIRTVGGLVMKLLGRVPKRGDTAETEAFAFTVLGVSGKQLVTILARDKRQAAPAPAGAAPASAARAG